MILTSMVHRSYNLSARIKKNKYFVINCDIVFINAIDYFEDILLVIF